MKVYCDYRTPSGVLITFLNKEFGFDIEISHVDLFAGANYQPEFLSVNPSGKTPVLLDGEVRLTQNASILRYLCRKYDKPGYPEDIDHRTLVDERLDFLISEFHSYVINVFFMFQIAPQGRIGIGRNDLPGEVFEFTLQHGRRYMGIINDQWLGGVHRYVAGDSITIADYHLAALLTVFDGYGLSMEAFPHIATWQEELFNLPNFKASWGPVKDLFAAAATEMRKQITHWF